MNADEVLAKMDALDANEEEIQYIIDENLRVISIPPLGVVLGVEGDKDVNCAKFKMVRYYKGIDLSKFEIRINFANANGDLSYYTVKNPTVTDDTLTFEWLVGYLVTKYKGTVRFLVRMITTDASTGEVQQAFDTTVGEARSLEGLLVDAPTDEKVYDIVAQLKADLTDHVNNLLETIPADYSELTKKVEDSTLGISELKDDLVNVKEIFDGNYQYLKSSEVTHGYYNTVNNKITHKTDTTGYVVFPRIKLKANVTYNYNNVFGKMSFIGDESGSLIRKLYDGGDDNVTSSIIVSTDSYIYLTVRADKVGIAMLYDGNKPSNYIEGYYDSLSIPSLRLNGNQLNRNFNLLDTYRSIEAKNGAVNDGDRIVLKAGNTCMGSKVFFTGLLPENLKGKKLTLNVEVAYDGYIYNPFVPTLNINCIGADGIKRYSVGTHKIAKVENGTATLPVELDFDYDITYIEAYLSIGFDYSSTGLDSRLKIENCYVTGDFDNFDVYSQVENNVVILDRLSNIDGYKLHINRDNDYILHIDDIKTTSFYETNKNISFCNMKTGHITNEITDNGSYLMLFNDDNSNDFMFMKEVSDYDVLVGSVIRCKKN